MTEQLSCACGWTCSLDNEFPPELCPQCGSHLPTTEEADTNRLLSVSEEQLAVKGPPPIRKAKQTARRPADGLAGLDEFGNLKPPPSSARTQDQRRRKERDLLKAERTLIEEALMQRHADASADGKTAATQSAGEETTAKSPPRRRSAFSSFWHWLRIDEVFGIWALRQQMQRLDPALAGEDRLAEQYPARAAQSQRGVDHMLRRQGALKSLTDKTSRLPVWVNNFGAALTALGLMSAVSLLAFLVSLGSLAAGLLVYVVGFVASRLAWLHWLSPVRDALRDYPTLRPQNENAFPRMTVYRVMCIGCGIFSGLMLVLVILVGMLR